jgi:hypothetical protein
LCLFFYLLFSSLVFILLAFVAHRVPPFYIVPPPGFPANSGWLFVPAPLRCPFTLRLAQCKRIMKTPFMMSPVKPEPRYWFGAAVPALD